MLQAKIEKEFSSASRRTTKYDSYFSSYAEALESLIDEKYKTNSKIKLLEVGVMDGGSLEAWKNILGQNSLVVGLDINPECSKLSCESYDVVIGDQSNPSVWRNLCDKYGSFDIVIDDGNHMGLCQSRTIDYCLAGAIGQSGVILIEDAHTAFIDNFPGSSVSINLMEKVFDLVQRINSRSGRLIGEPTSKLLHIKKDDIARKSISSIQIFESIIAIYVNRGLPDSKALTSNSVSENTITEDLTKNSALYYQ